MHRTPFTQTAERIFRFVADVLESSAECRKEYAVRPEEKGAGDERTAPSGERTRGAQSHESIVHKICIETIRENPI